MKILFTADLHTRIGQKSIPREWALNRYNLMFSEFDRVYKEYDCDYEIHGGDIFDKIPTLEELAVYMNYVTKRSKDRNIIIFDGNHEATKKGHTFLHHLEGMLGDVRLIKSPCTIPGVGDFIPYTHIKEKRLSKYRNSSVLYTHVRGEIPPHVKPEIDLEELDTWDLVLAGDLHAHSNSQRNIVYPGSPVTVSFHRNEVDTGVIVLDTQALEWEWVRIEVPQLIRETVENPDLLIKTEYNHTIYELVGDMMDLSKIDKDIDILDKKIIKNQSEATLDLTDLSIEDEIFIYLEDILGFNSDKIVNVLKVYNDNVQDADVE
jgi:DNA repair exonuclease SbcCD nuclease subunit